MQTVEDNFRQKNFKKPSAKHSYSSAVTHRVDSDVSKLNTRIDEITKESFARETKVSEAITDIYKRMEAKLDESTKAIKNVEKLIDTKCQQWFAQQDQKYEHRFGSVEERLRKLEGGTSQQSSQSMFQE